MASKHNPYLRLNFKMTGSYILLLNNLDMFMVTRKRAQQVRGKEGPVAKNEMEIGPVNLTEKHLK